MITRVEGDGGRGLLARPRGWPRSPAIFLVVDCMAVFRLYLRGGAAVLFRLGTDSQNRQSQIY